MCNSRSIYLKLKYKGREEKGKKKKKRLFSLAAGNASIAATVGYQLHFTIQYLTLFLSLTRFSFTSILGKY